ncbi:MAG: TetR/AcrR family transcriptional regulator [Bacteroidia bacterium]|nr:TetR/AcrR family transcriptional regulator [Bacteroidia bacterium]
MLDKIIEGCEKLFRRYGIKSLSMDDIARELGMSKKTIYQYVADKNDLVLKTFSHTLDCNKHKCTILEIESKNPIEEIILITREVSQHLQGINSSVFYDLKKYHPESWDMFNNFSNGFIYEKIKSNLIKGIERGYYRKDLNPDIISKVYISMVGVVTDYEKFSSLDYDFSHVYNEIVRYHFHGICTPKGLKFLNN